MSKEDFIKRLIKLRINKGVSAHDMSLSLGQSAGYINNIENGINLPSMTVFFYICDYFGITPHDFFDYKLKDPVNNKALFEATKELNPETINLLIALIDQLKK